MNAVVHDGPNPPVVRQRWMFTDLNFLPLGTNCVLMNRIWNGDTATEYAVGMKPPATANYKQDARWKLPPDFKPNHICHDEWLSTGEPWPNDLPPTVYDDFWIPVCCGAVNHLIGGGVEVGGPVHHTYGRNHSTRGGYQFGGRLSHTNSFAHSTRGGLEFGGPLAHVVGYTHAPLGGLEFGGPLAHVVGYTHAPLGGYQFGGPVVHTFRPASSPVGGVEVGGQFVHAFRPASSPVGGVEVGGQLVHAFRPASSPVGGVEVGGMAVNPPLYIEPALGGFELGGAAGEEFTPGGVVPGTDCFTAWEAHVGESLGFTIGAGASGWFKINLEAGTVYHIDFTGVSDTLTLAMAYSLDCDVYSPVGFITPHPGCRQWTTTVATRMVFWFTSTAGAVACTFKVDVGPCT